MIILKDLKFGVFVASRTPWVPLSLEIQEEAKEIERLGFHSIWFPDRLALRSSRFEVWTLLSALASITSRIRFGPLISPDSFRHPLLLAGMAATLDVTSKGRLEFGINPRWDEPKYERGGNVSYEPLDLVHQLQEAIEIIRLLWTEETVTRESQFFSIKEVSCWPKPIQKPYPPITVGDVSDKFTIGLVAQFADRFNLTGSIDTCRQKLDALSRYCSRVRRDYEAIEKSLFSYIQIAKDEADLRTRMKDIYRNCQISIPFKRWYENSRQEFAIAGTSDECVRKIEEFKDIGISFFILRFNQIPNIKNIREIKDQIVDCI